MISTKISIVGLLALWTSFFSNSHGLSNPDIILDPRSDDYNCICFDNPGPNLKVPEAIDVNNEGMERLVVYVYRKMQTKEIEIYIPNEKKQKLIPDLVLETGDILRPGTDSIEIVFNSSHNEIPIEYSTSELQKGPQTLGKEINQVTNNIKPIDIGPNQSWESKTLPMKSWDLNNNVFQNTKPNYVEVNPNNRGIDQPLSNVLYRDSLNKFRYPERLLIWDNNVKQDAKPNVLKPIDTVSYQPRDKMKYPQPINSWDSNINHNTKPYYDVESIIIEPYQFWDSSLYQNPKHNSAAQKEIGADLQNLSLRPILIGNTMPLQSLIQQYSKGDFPPQTESLYTQAILVAKDNPFEVLGTLPLGKTSHLSTSTISALIDKIKESSSSKGGLLNYSDLNNDNDIAEEQKNRGGKKNKLNENDESSNEDANAKDNNANKSKSQDKKDKRRNKSKDPKPSTSHSSNSYININGDSNGINRSSLDGDIYSRNLPDIANEVFKTFQKFVDLIIKPDEKEDPTTTTTTSTTTTTTTGAPPPYNPYYPSENQGDPKQPQKENANGNSNKENGGNTNNGGETPQDKKSGNSNKENGGNSNNGGGTPQDKKSGNSNKENGGNTNNGGGTPQDKKSEMSKFLEDYNNVLNNFFPKAQAFPDFVFPDWYFASRGGSDPESIPPDTIEVEDQIDDVYDGNYWDTGDFRIIGGNPATGSGTPLSNKGRSGYIN